MYMRWAFHRKGPDDQPEAISLITLGHPTLPYPLEADERVRMVAGSVNDNRRPLRTQRTSLCLLQLQFLLPLGLSLRCSIVHIHDWFAP